jgi:hypothetical protein
VPTKLLDDLSQTFQIFFDDPRGLLGARKLGPWLILIRFVGRAHDPMDIEDQPGAVELNQYGSAALLFLQQMSDLG